MSGTIEKFEKLKELREQLQDNINKSIKDFEEENNLRIYVAVENNKVSLGLTIDINTLS